ncbi:hypothetical protein FVP74_08005 [Microbacterium saccharophilum]|uniref:Major facilitator superfamily (MFS) profile domain-containing protein n=1 Tax=Microbacterium saccharophilum TaxID=1213358 RepID=A0A5C8I0S2_9MICO|nr:MULTISPECIES: hypothetical protein [Microbacterium]TXK11279.1 hypothetical protein FVP74_08005 [Microbacterium saccharophilum]GEP48607.1 hypothetical protein MSA03_21150 [Microbacterium saccharophilum]SFI16807.1 hypothetical protein SAMN04487751_0041 [Microbacterium saccharophilum]
MTRSSLWTVVGVIVAVVIAWFLVDVIFKLAWLIAKLGMVAIVAVVVFLVIRMLFRRSED